jgi:hypothetical protein
MQNSKDNFGKSDQQLWIKGKRRRTVTNSQWCIPLWRAKHLYEVQNVSMKSKTSLWSSSVLQIKFKIRPLSDAEHIAANFLSSDGGDYKKWTWLRVVWLKVTDISQQGLTPIYKYNNNIIIFINCNWVVTRWQRSFCMYAKYEIGY